MKVSWLDYGIRKAYGFNLEGLTKGGEDLFLPWENGHFIIAARKSVYQKGSLIIKFDNSFALEADNKLSIGLNKWKANKKFEGATIGTLPSCFYEFKSEDEFSQFWKKIKKIKHNAKNACFE